MFLLFWTLGHPLRSILPPSPAPSKRYSRRTKIFVAIQDSSSPSPKYIDTDDMFMVSDSPPHSNVSAASSVDKMQVSQLKASSCRDVQPFVILEHVPYQLIRVTQASFRIPSATRIFGRQNTHLESR